MQSANLSKVNKKRKQRTIEDSSAKKPRRRRRLLNNGRHQSDSDSDSNNKSNNSNELDISSLIINKHEESKLESLDDCSSMEGSKVIIRRRKLRKLVCSNRQSLAKMS